MTLHVGTTLAMAVPLVTLVGCKDVRVSPYVPPSADSEGGRGLVQYGPGQGRRALKAALASCGVTVPDKASRAELEQLIDFRDGGRLPATYYKTFACPQAREVSQ